MTKAKPIFIHSGWRTGSTYVWTKFRRQPTCLAFYEPFNEMLSTMSPAEVYLARHDLSALHHSEIGLPYFHEYIPLLGPTGHKLFKIEFSYRNYFVVDEDLPGQRAYIESLLELADRTRRQPVLGFVRSLGRVAWFRRNFTGSLNIVVIRSPMGQWLSARELARQHQHEFFDPMQALILSEARGSPVAAEQGRRLGVPRLDEPSSLPAAQRAMAEFTARLRPVDRFRIFACLYALSYLAAIPHADLVIDMDRLSADSAYRTEIATEIRRLTGLELDLSDASMPRHVEAELASELLAAVTAAEHDVASGVLPLPHPQPEAAEVAQARALIAAKFAEDRALLAEQVRKTPST